MWRLTPHETATFVQQRAEHERDRMALHFSAAWHCAAFMRSKQLPKLKDVLNELGRKKTKITKPPPPQTPEELEAWKREQPPEPIVNWKPLPPEEQPVAKLLLRRRAEQQPVAEPLSRRRRK